MITADQLIVHAIGDYVLQSDWMASDKVKRWFPAFCHALVYSLGFLVFRPSLAAWIVIFGTHYFIDRYRLARYVVWAKNWLAPHKTWMLVVRLGCQRTVTDGAVPDGYSVQRTWRQATPPFSWCSGTGYPPERPAWLAVWLLIVADNVCHVVLNAVALRWL